MIIIGIDPGTATTGFGIIEYTKGKCRALDYGCIKTDKALSNQKRLSLIREDLGELMKVWKPQHAAVEKLFFSKNVTTGIAVAQSRGVILQKLQESEVEIYEYTPNEAKINICGDGKASKQGMQKMVKMILGLKEIPRPDDAADALALALCHAQNIPLLTHA